jgi:hypothetical protein
MVAITKKAVALIQSGGLFRVMLLSGLQMAFCDFCPCEGCRTGERWLFHAQTEDGTWICDVCYDYEVCMDAQRKETGSHNGPCDGPCTHRPKITSKWTDLEGNPPKPYVPTNL